MLGLRHESVVVRSARILYTDHQCHQLGVIETHVSISQDITMHAYLSVSTIYISILSVLEAHQATRQMLRL